ncbi:Diacylglycerol acyltransferase/mycolyltransferase Ag85C precursor [Corynebacterium freiburgense]|nr:Diacylglycerol acyltransferase/mycolyltransferase Ag85C precursor [Corynebacterium freiburgense]
MNVPLLRHLYNLAVTKLSRLPNAPGGIEALLTWCHTKGYRSLPFPAVFRSDAVYITPSNERFDAPRVAHRFQQPGASPQGVERWIIESPAMQRNVHVQVLRLGNPEIPAPLLFLLDGSSAPSNNGWILHGHIAKTLAGENVTVIMPTEASGSHYADWLTTDPELGFMQWETFLCRELPPLLEHPDNGLRTNGQRIIGGLSMGASAAVRLANNNPGLFHGVIGISGCYSTTDPVGWEYHHAISRSVGGHTRNLWDAEHRWKADVCLQPSGLYDSAVYLFTADGRITPRDIDFHKNRPFQELLGSVLLEFASWCCTQRLDNALKTNGHKNYHVVYQHGGIHDWIYCSEQLQAGWAWIKKRLASTTHS